jgi:hypothetical protein
MMVASHVLESLTMEAAGYRGKNDGREIDQRFEQVSVPACRGQMVQLDRTRPELIPPANRA